MISLLFFHTQKSFLFFLLVTFYLSYAQKKVVLPLGLYSLDKSSGQVLLLLLLSSFNISEEGPNQAEKVYNISNLEMLFDDWLCKHTPVVTIASERLSHGVSAGLRHSSAYWTVGFAWMTHAGFTVAAVLCVCLSAEAEIIEFCLMHHRHRDAAVPQSAVASG